MKPFQFYILDQNNNPVATEDIIEVAIWKHHNDSVVRQQYEVVRGRTYFISTVFLMFDNRSSEEECNRPLLWETMIFDEDSLEGGQVYKERYASYADALKGHQEALAYLRSLPSEPD